MLAPGSPAVQEPGNQRMVAHAKSSQRFHTADTSEESWVRLGRGGDRGQIRSEQHFWWLLDWLACNVSPLLTDVSLGSLYHFFYIMQGGIAFHKSGKARSAKQCGAECWMSRVTIVAS